MTPKFTTAAVSWVLFCFFFTACSDHNNEDKLKDTADSFARTYFNWQFNEALAHCTTSSQQWIQYAASQVTQADVDLLRGMETGASCELKSIQRHNGDTTATVVMTVENFLSMDSIQTTGRIIPSAYFQLDMVYRNKLWKVDLSGPPRALKGYDQAL